MAIILSPGDYTVPQPPPPQVIVTNRLLALQDASWQLLWGVGRSTPIANPPTHGTASWLQGEPSQVDFKPAVLPTKESDNLYCLRRLAQSLDPQAVASASTFRESQWLQVDKPQNVQALETDWHVQLGQKVWNPGLQLLPGTPWTVRAFDYVQKKWVTLAGPTLDPVLLTQGFTLSAEYAFNAETLVHMAVGINDQRFPVSFSQPVATTQTTAFSFNKACQCDAKPDGSTYKLKIGKLVVSFT